MKVISDCETEMGRGADDGSGPCGSLVTSKVGRHWHPIFDISAVAVIFLADWMGTIPYTKTPVLLLLGWVSLRLRRVRWRDIGFMRLEDWPRTLGVGIGCGIAIAGFQLLACQPLVAWIFGEQPDLSDFDSLHGNLTLLLLLLAVSWAVAAFGEEMVYRGYLMNRVADWGRRGRKGWVVSALSVSFAFGVAHASQGPSGMVVEGLAGLWLAIIYLRTKRNLLVPIIAHGIQNTIDFLLIYFGIFPGM